jgi:hypothetical protein
MSECFVKLPVEVLESPDLEPLDKLTWCAIASFRFNGQSTCFPGMKKIRDRLGLSRCKRQILRSIQKLTDLGFLEIVKKENGRPNEYRPSLPVTPVSLVTPEAPLPPQASDTHVTGDVQDTSDVHVTPPVTPMSPEEDVLKKIKNSPPIIPPPEDGGVSSVASATEKKPRKKRRSRADKWPLLTDPDEIRETIAAQVNPELYRPKFPDLDIDSTLLLFREVATEGTAQKPGANPYKWRDWPKAFRNFCQNQMKFYRDRLQAKRVSDRDHFHEAPKASPDEIKARDERMANVDAWAEIQTLKELLPDQYEAMLNEARASPDGSELNEKVLQRKLIALVRSGWTPDKETS